MKRIKTAIIGSGFMGGAHLEALQRIGGVEVVMIASDDVRSGKSLTDKFSVQEFILRSTRLL